MVLIVQPFPRHSQYDVAVDVETEFTVLAEQYAMWRSTAPPDVKAQWDEKITPLFVRSDMLIDSYKMAVLAGGETGDIVRELKSLKTQILMELAQRYGEVE